MTQRITKLEGSILQTSGIQNDKPLRYSDLKIGGDSSSKSVSVEMSKKKTILIVSLSLAVIAAVALATISLFLLLDLSKALPEPLIVVLISLAAISAGACFVIFATSPASYLPAIGSGKLKTTITWGLIGGVFIAILNFPYAIFTKEIVVPEGFIIELNSGLIPVGMYLFVSTILLPITEELYFRGCLYRLIRTSFDSFWAFLVSTILFIIGHEFNRAEHIFWMAVTSAILTYIYHRTASTLASAIAHCFWSFSWFLTYYANHLGWF